MFMRDDIMTSPVPPAFSAAQIDADWQMLCSAIGERRAGSPEEQRAAGYIAECFQAAGISDVKIEPFPCASLRSATTEVHERNGRDWKSVEARALVGAPSTPGGRPVTGEMVWLELPENAARIQPRAFRDRIVAVFGPLPTSLTVHRRLVAAEPLAVIHVDDRLPFPWVKNDGIYPHWARTHGMPPTLTVPYLEGWRWRRDGVRELKVRVDADLINGRSQNVVGELPGRSPELPAIVLTAHHDTQCGNSGADDNASGVVTLLALARAFAGARLRRTVRVISFGAEEQLSVGSSAYVRQHRIKPAQVGLVINFDSVSSPLGHWVMSVPGNTALARHARFRLAARGLDVETLPEITPFSDQFPFNRVGIPSLWFMRTNFPGGRWQHHSEHDSLENVSIREVQRLLGAVHPLIVSLASQAKWPFPSKLPAREQALARRLGRELFG
jgi:acetylornithine deacetylase/succinyl-diaminopimelate desuccinylase-like protein